MPPLEQSTPYTPKNTDKIKQAMAQKEKSIEKFQDSKERSMQKFSCERDAVLITTAKMRHKEMTDDEIEAEIKKWHKVIETIFDSPFI